MSKKRYECDACHKVYKIKKYYDKHMCEEMRRAEEMKTNIGISAFELYKMWFVAKKQRVPKKETFMTSTFYKPMIRFAEFSKQMAIPDKEGYIEYMVELKLNPTYWYKNEVYQKYIDNFDKLYTPLEQVNMTVDTLLQLEKIFDCTIKKALYKLQLDDVNKLIQAKKLSPWVLLLSETFMNYIRQNASTHEKIMLDTLINPKVWHKRLYSNKKLINNIKKIVSEFDM